MSYFSIDFEKQIVELQTEGFCAAAYYCTLQDQAQLGSFFQKNPSLAQVNAILNDPAVQILNYAGGNYSPAPYTASEITAIADIGGLVNAASTRIHGIDVAPRYVGADTAYGRFRADLDATYYLKYDQQVTAGTPTVSIDNTTYNPLRFRAKANVGWDMSGWSSNVRVNFANAYKNTQDPSCTTDCTISSWTTVDLALSYATLEGRGLPWLSGVRVGLTATNVFNHAPPFVNSTSGYRYDPINASALMRAFSLTFTKHWGGGESR
jgi:iron complex outermembrane receptor protein